MTSFEDAQQRVINKLMDSLEAHDRLLEKIKVETNSSRKKYLESICVVDFEEKINTKLRLIKEGNHYQICKELYSIDPNNRYSYSGYGFGILIETEYHDTFRMSYDDFGDRKEHYEGYEFHSLEETISFLDQLSPEVENNGDRGCPQSQR